MRTNPLQTDNPLILDLSPWNESLARLSWAGTTNNNYEILVGPTPIQPSSLVTIIPGRFPETEYFVAYTNLTKEFLRVRSRSLPSHE
jgi:hypothetical protein